MGREAGRNKNVMTESNKNQVGMNGKKWFLMRLVLATAAMFLHREVTATQTPVNLGTAGNYVILTKSGISTVPSSAITGDIGVSPIDASAITGFSLIRSTDGTYSTSPR
jgi:hypothetical protein